MPKMVIEVPGQFVEVGKAMTEHLAMLQRTVDRLGGGKAVVVLGNSIYERSATPPGFPNQHNPARRGAEASGDSQKTRLRWRKRCGL